MKLKSRTNVTISDSEKVWWTRRGSNGYNPWDYVTTYSHAWSGAVIPNCTGFCYGYILKSINYRGNTEKAWTGNGCKWYSSAVNKTMIGYKVTSGLTQTPSAPSIVCWGGIGTGNLQYGHVAICIDYNSSTNRLTVLESGNNMYGIYGGMGIYKTVFDCSSDFNYPLSGSSYPFQGFIPLTYSTTVGDTSTASNWTATNWIGYNVQYCSATEMANNAQMVAKFCQNNGWDLLSACAMLGNLQQESTINPMLYQGRTLSGDGYGLSQISSGMLGIYNNGYDTTVHLLNSLGISTPTNADGWGDGEMQILQNILSGVLGGIWQRRDTWNTSGNDFMQNTDNHTLNELTLIFEQNYENAGSPAMERRYAYAQAWYDYISPFWGSDTENGDTEKDKDIYKMIMNTKPWWKRINR